jgi:hypothetical protein
MKRRCITPQKSAYYFNDGYCDICFLQFALISSKRWVVFIWPRRLWVLHFSVIPHVAFMVCDVQEIITAPSSVDIEGFVSLG